MIRLILAATALLSSVLLAPSEATAQSVSQSELRSHYDRALAAGYKALFLCSAIANAEAVGQPRTEDSVLAWELTGIQAPLDAIVRDLPHTIWRTDRGTGALSYVSVDWDDTVPPRIAWHQETGGCAVGPLGMEAAPARAHLRYSSLDSIILYSARVLPRELAAVFGQALDEHYGENTRTTAIIIGGKDDIEYWQYADDFTPFTPQRTWSVAKSIAATLIGAAVQHSEANVAATAGLGEEEGDPRRAVTIDDALRMASGRYSDTPGNRTDPLYFGGAAVDEVALDWPLIHTPGTVFRYANNDTLAAVQAIAPTFEDHPPAELFATLGMDATVAETDWQGNYILSSQVWSTAPDLARLGQLYLNDGVWNGERILPEEWVEYVSTPSGPQPEGGRGWGYGAGWWLLNNSEGIPADTILAAGNRGQYIVVIPSRDLVIVRRGEDPAGGSGFDIEAFTRDVLAALSTD